MIGNPPPDPALTTALEALRVATTALERTVTQRQTEEVPRWLRAREVAAILGLSVQHVYALMARNVLPTVRINRAVRVPEDALRAYMADMLGEQTALTIIRPQTMPPRHLRGPIRPAAPRHAPARLGRTEQPGTWATDDTEKRGDDGTARTQ